MKYLHPVACVPNELIRDTTVHYTTKSVALALLFLSGRKGRSVRISIGQLAAISHCSTATVQQALRELIERGYIVKRRCYRYSEQHGHLIYGANAYTWIRRSGGYTLISREIMGYDLTPAALNNLLYLYLCGSKEGRAHPSLRHIAGLLLAAGKVGLDMAKSTVCRGLRQLQKAQAVIRLCCRTVHRCFAANSYLLTDPVQSDRQALPQIEGSPKFDKPSIITQLTMDYTERENKYGVAQFVNLPDLGGYGDSLPIYRHDGTGVLVCAADEQELSA